VIPRTFLLAAALVASASAAACQGCGPPQPPQNPAAAAKPTLRLYALSSIAGALEPCGCSKDQLGGADHLAAFLAAEDQAAPARAVISAGPLLFLSPTLDPERKAQDEWKADALAAFAQKIGLVAWAPGGNDWAAGPERAAKWFDGTKATVVAANLKGLAGAKPFVVKEVGGQKVAFIGLADPRDRAGQSPAGLVPSAAPEALGAAIEGAKKDGANILVGLSTLPRGEALRLVEKVPDLHVMVLGKQLEVGDQNDKPKAPEIVGTTLVVETANHMQSIAVVDLFVAPGATGAITFKDGTGIARAEEAVSLAGRIRDLEARINGWEQNPSTNKKDLADRKAELAELRAKKSSLETPQAPPEGSFFRYKLVEVREAMGVDAGMKEAMRAFYKKVNEHNKVAFADRKPEPAEPGKASYVGVEKCSECHPKPRKVWDATPHAHAYATLQKDFKEYNLECTSCHVTGYGKPGGSTVAYTDKLQNVGCEECHGPGSLHSADEKKKGLIIRKPDPIGCVKACHHPPHVDAFDPVAKMELVLGPGHGR